MSHTIGRGRYRGETYPAAGGGRGTGLISTFVFKQGGADTGPVIFNTMRGACNAANALHGAVTTIRIDHSIVGAIAHVVNDGLGPYDMSGVQLVGGGDDDILIFDDGVTLSVFPHSVYSVVLNSHSHSPIYVAPPVTHVPLTQSCLSGRRTILAINFAPFIVVPNSAYFSLNLIGITGLGTNGPIGSIETNGTGQTWINAIASQIVAGALTGTGRVDVVRDSASMLGAQTVTTLNDTLLSDASRETYTATNIGDWSGTNPSSIANALDRIAAKITPIP